MIGICTPFKMYNYGTKLQAYAVQEKIRELGYDFEIINFNRKSDMRINKLFLRYCNKDYILSKILKKDKVPKNKIKEYKKNIKIRKKTINLFDKKYYNLTDEINGYKKLVKYSKKYKALICGSDQIWFPTSINNPTSTLEFGQKNTKRISFASSFGISEIPKKYIKKYKKFLLKFDDLSVREQQGVKIIEKLTGKKSKLILDPTLTVDKKIWDKLSDKGRILVKDKYVFCCFLGSNEEHRKSVYEIAKKKKLKIVTLAHFKKYNACDEKYTDIQLYDVTPNDFIRLIKDAELVCTDSFHATVFSIIYHKLFYTFERFDEIDKLSTNSRIYSLLSLLKIKNRIPIKENNYKLIEEDINFDKVDLILNQLKKETDKYLKQALKGINKKEV